MGRKPIFDKPMTPAERKALSRANLIADVGIHCSSIEVAADAITSWIRGELPTEPPERVQVALEMMKESALAIRRRVGGA